MTEPKTVAQLEAMKGRHIGTSAWMDIDQARIDTFAGVTEDHQFIHTDPAAARETPFGGTIAHGFLTLSLLSRMVETGLPAIANMTMSVNYGFDKVRFLAPVPSGSRVRAHFVLAGVTVRSPGNILFHHQVSVEIEGHEKPALAADWLILAAVG